MLKIIATLSFALLLAAGSALAQMKDKDMGGMDMGDEHGAMMTHHASGVVKSVDAQSGKVTLAHGPVKTLDWSAMTMTFHVRDRGMMPKFKMNQKVQFSFVQEGKDYVITEVK